VKSLFFKISIELCVSCLLTYLFAVLCRLICSFHAVQVIVASLLKEFPQQSVWMMMAVSKSSYPMRVKRCQEIFAHARSLRPELSRFLNDMTRLVDKLLDLCNRQEGAAMVTSTLSITQHFKPLQRLLDDKDFR
jgi:serine/threonine-protein kinase ATR